MKLVKTARPLGRTRFRSQLQVRPDDIDMNQHVHSSRYLDYVLAARFEQMARDYGAPMEAFTSRGLGWYMRKAEMEFLRPLRLGDALWVETWVNEMYQDGVQVGFEILRQPQDKLSCRGAIVYTLVNLSTGRASLLPEDLAAKYAI